jgi:hypothetical protein
MRAYVNPPFAWPVEGPITSYMSSDHPLGIDIGLSEERSREIKAAADGTVKFSGGSDDDSYGFHIVIDHGNRVETLYGHLSQRIAHEGDVMRQGQLIGIGGSSGKSDGMHLHFEVSKDGRQFDPLELLPNEPGDGEPLDFDCKADTLTIDAGSRVTFDLAGLLVAGESVTGINIRDADGFDVEPDVIDAEASGLVSVDLRSRIDFEGPVHDDPYTFVLLASANGRQTQTIECAIDVHTPRVYPGFYERAGSTATTSRVESESDQDAEAPATTTSTPQALLTVPPDFPTGLATFTPAPSTPVATSTPKPTATPLR